MIRPLSARFQGCAFYPDAQGGPAITPDPFALDLLQKLETKARFENAILRGSTLYQPYVNNLHNISSQHPPKDYDVLVGFGEYEQFRQDQAKWRGYSPSNPLTLIDFLGLSQIIKNPEIRFASAPDLNRQYFVNIGATYKGRQIDLFVQNIPHTLEEVALGTETPLTGIAMDSKGHFRVHPLFAEHARQLVYAPLNPATGQKKEQDPRFDKLSTKFPGLRQLRPPPPLFLRTTRPHP